MNPASRRSLLPALGSVLALLAGLYLWTSDRPVFVDSTYCMIAVSLFRDGDLFLLDHEPKIKDTEYHLTVTGHLSLPQVAGAGIVAYPFYWLGEYFQSLFWPLDSEKWEISAFYGPVGRYRLLWYNASAVFSGLLYLLLMHRICRRWASPAASALALAAVLWGTEMWLMLWFTQGGSELIALLFIALLIRLTLFLDDRPALSPYAALLLGLLAGWIVFVRLQAAVWIALPAVYGLKWRREGKLSRRGLFFSLLLASGGFALALLPQALIFKEWYGRYYLDPYGGGLAKESLVNLLRLLPDHPEFLTLSLVPFLGVFGLVISARALRPLVLASAVIIPATLAMLFTRRSGLEYHAYLGSRYCLILAPIFMIGLAALFGRCRTLRSRALISAAACLFAYTAFIGLLRHASPSGFSPDLSAAVRSLPPAETLPGLFRAAALALPLLPRLLWEMLAGPRSPDAWMTATGCAPFVLLGLALWASVRSRPRLFSRISPADILSLAALLGTAVTLSLVIRGIERSRLMTGQWEREGLYRDRWRTLRYDWSNAVDDLQLRSLSYLEAGMLGEAERLLALSMAIKPIREGAVADLGDRLVGEYHRRGIVRHPWQAICSAYGVSGAVLGAGGVVYRGSGGITDGDLLSCALADQFVPPAQELEIALDPRRRFSDVLVVFESHQTADRLEVAVSSDGRRWEKPYRADRRGDTLWIWDFYQRPWRFILLRGFRRPEEASLREVFAIMSPRHGPLAGRGEKER